MRPEMARSGLLGSSFILWVLKVLHSEYTDDTFKAWANLFEVSITRWESGGASQNQSWSPDMWLQECRKPQTPSFFSVVPSKDTIHCKLWFFCDLSKNPTLHTVQGEIPSSIDQCSFICNMQVELVIILVGKSLWNIRDFGGLEVPVSYKQSHHI